MLFPHSQDETSKLHFMMARWQGILAYVESYTYFFTLVSPQMWMRNRQFKRLHTSTSENSLNVAILPQ